MSNIMLNGTVLPHGLLGSNGPESSMIAFNRSYSNTGLKAGMVVKSYAATDSQNVSKLCTEYDVIVMEQFENKGSVPTTYKNCLSYQGLGSIADYLEFTLRQKTFQTNKGFPTFSGQDGAIVLIQCLDNIGCKAIVVGNLIHPDRTTDIIGTDPRLVGEYNGVNVQIANDGSCSLTFKGATDSKGVPTDPSQGPTTFQIKTDGSFEFNHATIDILADKSGTLSITTKKDVSITANGDTKITTTGKTDIVSTGTTTIDGDKIKLGENAEEAVVKGDTFAKIFNKHVHTGNLGISTSPPLAVMDPALSKKTFTE